jgi:hypothetical protein
MINKKKTIFGIEVPLFIFLFSLGLSLVTFYVHIEVCITKLDIELAELRNDYLRHIQSNSVDFSDIKATFEARNKEIIKKIDDIQTFLLNQSNHSK